MLAIHVSGTEAVVDVHDGYTAGTGIQHAEQRCDPAQGGAVSDAGRDGDDGTVCQTADDRGQSSFHTGDGDDAAGAHNGVHVREKAMNPGNPDVVEADYLIPQHLGGDSCFFGHRNVACSARSDDHFADSGGSGHYTDDTGARQLVIIQRSDPAQTLADEVRDLLRDPGDQNGLLTVLEHGLRDPEDVLLRFPRTVDDLGNTFSAASSGEISPLATC